MLFWCVCPVGFSDNFQIYLRFEDSWSTQKVESKFILKSRQNMQKLFNVKKLLMPSIYSNVFNYQYY